MTPTISALFLILAHFTGDWWWQSRHMAMNKSKDIMVLLTHLIQVSFFVLLAAVLIYMPVAGDFTIYYKVLINAVLHGLIDWNIWKMYAKDKPAGFEYWKEKTFYGIIAIDQFLHLSILFILFL